MKNGKASIAFPILIIAIGIGWLLTTHNLLPGVDWIWILSLGVLGGSTLAVWGIDKVAIVVGPFLIVCTFLSLLGQTGRMSVDTEVPLLVTLAGVLMLVSRCLPVPVPKWMIEARKANED